ncbi:hypothetical protein [Polymorphospora rubra]|uniref:Uncharacterized protein n=1 Tax=Polymorphospora rubra TaxID=338584 RepID=A0A810N2I7_9ACTN|nr:hypothetical protein [Polymorphospora rubra]BCJ67596.1 hypothetical protein Prubr_46170 [Polymorphospora rubra]
MTRAAGRWSRPRRLAATVAAAVCVVVASCYGCDTYTDYRQAVEVAEAERVLTTYLERVRDGDFRGAHELLCGDVLHDYTEAEHEEFLRRQPPLADFRLGEPDRWSSLEGSFLTFGVDLTSRDGAVQRLGFALALYSGGQPRVCDRADWRDEWSG